MNNNNRVWGLDLMRAVAVMGVLLSHLPYHTGKNVLQNLFPIGPVFGVEIFFVLSGFLIGQILIKEFFSSNFEISNAIGFMRRRWFRTLPNYYLFLGIMLVLQWNIGQSHILSFATFTQNLISKPVAGFYGVTWSLTIEEIFYLSFPLSLVFFNKVFPDRCKAFATVLFIFLLFPFLIRYYVLSDLDQAGFRKASIIRLDAISYGVLAALTKLRFSQVWVWLGKQGFVLLLPFCYLFLVNKMPSLGPQDWASVYFPLLSFTIALFLPIFDNLKSYEGFLSSLITFLAKISYSLYLCHIPVIIVSNKFLGVRTYLNGHFLEIFYITASVSLAYLIYQFWEKPFMNLR